MAKSSKLQTEYMLKRRWSSFKFWKIVRRGSCLRIVLVHTRNLTNLSWINEYLRHYRVWYTLEETRKIRRRHRARIVGYKLTNRISLLKHSYKGGQSCQQPWLIAWLNRRSMGTRIGLEREIWIGYYSLKARIPIKIPSQPPPLMRGDAALAMESTTGSHPMREEEIKIGFGWTSRRFTVLLSHHKRGSAKAR
jgi:hypothetical protein